MSYADIVLQRRKELENAFRERYNPAEDVLSTLADIDKEMFRRKGIEAEQERAAAAEKRRAEMFGLEKSREEALAKKYEAEAAQTREDRAALARERDARAAAAREEARRKAEAAALEGGARDIYGRLLAKGQTLKNVLSASGRDEAEKAYAKKMAGALAGGTTADVAKLDAELADAQKRLEEKPPGGYTVSDIEEMAEAYGTSYGAMLAEVQRMEAEDEESRLKMGLTGEKSESERALQEQRRSAAAKYARQGYPKPEKEQTPEEKVLLAARVRHAESQALIDDVKLAILKSKAGLGSRGELTDAARKEIQSTYAKTTTQMAALRTLRDLIQQYPDLKEFTGPLAQWKTKLIAAFGSEKASQIMTTFDSAFNEYRIAVTGAAAGPSELQMLRSNMPGLGDRIESIIGKLQAHENIYNKKLIAGRGMLDSGSIYGADAVLGIPSDAGEMLPEEEPMTREEADQYFEETP